MGSPVVRVRRTCDSMVVSSLPDRHTIGWLVLQGWVTVFGQAYHLGMLPATQANSASYPVWDRKTVPAEVR